MDWLKKAENQQDRAIRATTEERESIFMRAAQTAALLAIAQELRKLNEHLEIRAARKDALADADAEFKETYF